jgi:DNA-directed RNA polymerase
MSTQLTEAQVQRQLQLEEDMRGEGIARYRRQVAAARDYKDESSTKVGAAMLQKAMVSLTAVVTAFFEEANSGKAGKRHSAIKLLAGLEPEVIAFITAKSLIDSISQRRNLQSCAKAVGQALEEEAWFRKFADQKPALWRTITETMLEEQVPSNLRQARLVRTAKKYEVDHARWTPQERHHVGMKAIDMMIEATGWIEKVDVTERSGTKVRTKSFLRATEETMAFINDENARCELLTPVYLPMVVPPREWTTPLDGGYLSPSITRKPMVKTMNKAFMEELKNHEMPKVYAAVNALQRSAWQINTDLLPVIKELFAQQSPLGKLPAVRTDDVPPFPSNKEDKDAVTAWRRKAAGINEGNTKRKSKRIACAKAIWVAEKFQAEERFYFPYYCDFRGRVYARPLFLTPQGADYSKALLRFADGIELGEQGACWLAIHGANLWGFDKVSLQDRIDWVQAHEEQILASAADPLDFVWWGQADKPLQFLAFCMEWAGFKREGEGFKSKIAVALDGSCNGLQNFSMALRDSVGGAAVNLLPSEKPQDIYQRVADVVLAKLRLDQSENGSVMATQWIDSGLVGRKLCKKPVMTLPYGAKEYGMRGGIVDFIAEARDEGKTIPWDDLFPAAQYIGRLIWSSIGEVVIAARAAMDFLQQVAQVAAREGLPIHWMTPVGFPVMQEYRELIGKRVKTQIGGAVCFLWLNHEGDKLDRRKQSAGISPNFVHSLDSAHMMATVNVSAENGIEDFAMVHDSFGTHAANTPALAVFLRQAFVEQYRADVLSEFRARIADQLSPENLADLPEVPQMGDLDIEQVLDSDFFFA